MVESLEQRRLLTVSASAQPPLTVPPDIANLEAPGPAAGAFDPGGDQGHVWSNRPIQGQTFTTGNNPNGYTLHAVSLQNEENTVNNNTAGFTVRIGTVSGNTFTQIASRTANNAVSYVPNDYMTFTFTTGVQLQPNTLYAFEWDAAGSGFTTWNNVDTTYPNGQGYSSGGGGVPNDAALVFRGVDRVFHVDLEDVVPPSLQVVDSLPGDGDVLGTAPGDIRVDFNVPLSASTVQAADLEVDGVAATGVSVIDSDTVVFSLSAQVTSGTHTMVIAAGLIESAEGLLNELYTAQFTLAEPAQINNVPASSVTAVSAVLGGEVTATGGDVPTVTIYYGSSDGGTTPGSWESQLEIGTHDGPFSTPITGLAPGTNYFFRAYASNVAGQSWAASTSMFATPGAALPTIGNRPATSVTATSAIVHGEVTDTGGQPPLVTIFYGDEDGGTIPGQWDESIQLGQQSGMFSAVLTRLDAQTTHYYRAQATNDAGTAWAADTATFTTSELVPPTVVINEIHYDPADDTSPAEFIELYNAGDQTQDLTGWYFDDGIEYAFPAGTTIAPGGYLVVAASPAEIQALFGVNALGPWTGALNNSGERIRLRNPLQETVDTVDYQLGFPWPTVGSDPSHSIELINAGLDNDLGGSWRSSAGDPGPEQTFFVQGSQWRYFKGTQEPSTVAGAWRQINFDDANWFTGATAIGYGDGHVITSLSDMQGNYSTVYLRKQFEVDSVGDIASLLLEAQFDDGINVWINGMHVAGSSVSGPELPYTAIATSAGEDTTFRQFIIPSAPTILRAGTNVIAVQLLNGSLAGSSDAWFDARLRKAQGTGEGPTPGAANNATASNAAPQMRQVDHSPQQPVSGQDVTITMKVTDPDGVESVSLAYQLVDPGSYIRITDAAYQTNWTTIEMVDNGTAGDAVAGDDVYTAVLTGTLQTHRRLVRYRVTASDALGTSVTVPYADDPQPNFAYFVYDGVPSWSGSGRPGIEPVITYPAEVMGGISTYHLIANETDINNSQYNGSFNLVQFPGTVVYDGVVYDHMLYRNRGRASTYQVGKNKWKLNFNLGHEFEARDNYGNKYQVAWDKINVLPGTNPWWRDNVSTEGTILFEPVAFRLYELAGTPSSKTHFFQLRVIDSAIESSRGSQYEGDNWGLYIAIEQPEREFLDERGLPDGNIFNLHGVGGASQRSQGSELPTDRSDLSSFVNGYRSSQPLSWWENNLNFESYFAWNAINLAVNNSDLRPEENVNYYHNQETGQWYTLPWDLDLTFEDAPHLGRPDSQWESIQNAMNQHSQIRQLYQNRVRELLDLLMDSGDAARVVDELANVVTKGAQSDTLVEANQAMWDYHPRKNKKGIWYQNFNPSLLTERSFAGLVQYMQRFVSPGGYGYNRLASKAVDNAIPIRPTISYVGPDGFPSDQLTFQASPFRDPQGGGTFGAMQWRVAEVYYPGVPNYEPGQPNIYEIEGTWQSEELTSFVDQITVPGTALKAGHTYRARVRMQDNTGRYSNWSAPVEFTVSSSDDAARAGDLVISELNYNPPAPTPSELAINPALNNNDFEFIEITNVSDRTVSLVNVQFAEGIEYHFDDGAILSLGPQERVVIAADLDAFQLRYGTDTQIAGVFADGNLANDGEQLTLLDANGDPIVSFVYDDAVPWPVAADGYGFTMVLKDPQSNPDHSNPFHWRASGMRNGSPGGEDQATQPPIVINEVLTHTDPPEVDAIELYNPTTLDVDVSGWFLSDDNGALQKFVIAAGTTILAGQTVVIREDDDANPLTVPPTNYFGGAFSLSSTGDEIVLSAGDGQRLLGYTHGFSFGAAENGRSFIRHVDSTGYEYLTAQSGSPGRTLGAENNPYFVGDVVITEVHYNPKGSDPNQLYVDEFIEIQNTTGGVVTLFDPAHPANAWRIDGIDFTFPGNSVLNAGQRALIVPIDPAVFRASYAVDAAVQILGPYTGSLDNGGEWIALQRPDTPDASLVPYIDVDVVRYDDQSPWPTSADGSNGEGHSLTRLSWSDFGSDPASWVGAVPSPGAADTVTVSQVIIAGDDTDPADLPTGPQPVSWQQQRSQLLSLVVEFTEPVVVTAADLQLTNLGRNAPLDADQPVAITEDQLSLDGRRLTIRFDNAGLEDGVYRLQIADSVHGVSGQALDGDYDGVAGGSFVFQGSDDNRFHVLIGDWNGDAAVTIFDFPVFSYWFGRSVPTSPSYVDLNGDDGVTIFDFGLFAERFGDSVVYPPPGLVAESVGAIADQLDPKHAGNSAAPPLARGGAAPLPATFARTTVTSPEPTVVGALDQVLTQWRDPSPSPNATFVGWRSPRPLSAHPSQPSDEVDGPVGADDGFAFDHGLCDDLWSCKFDY